MMASSHHNLASIDPCWSLRNLTTFPDSDSFFPHNTFPSCDYHSLSDTVPPFLNNPPETTTPSSTVVKRHRNTVVSATGKVSKRKSRASKRCQTTTTYITADPLNFREMVQQVTGVRPEGSSHVPMPPRILKPEAHRPPRSRLPLGELFLPTLDTSSPFLHLDHRKDEEEAVGSTPTPGPDLPQPPAHLAFQPPLDVLDFDAYLDFPTHFPTFESSSWKVMS